MRVQSTGLNADPDKRGEALMQAVTFPEEDRRLFTTADWHGEYRWFRSPNVVPLEQWRNRWPNQPKQK